MTNAEIEMMFGDWWIENYAHQLPEPLMTKVAVSFAHWLLEDVQFSKYDDPLN